MHWSIGNSSECMSKIKNVNTPSVYTFDFSTLYTNLPLIDIHDKLTKLIKKMYQNANAHYILVNTYTGKAFWSHTDKGSLQIIQPATSIGYLGIYSKQHMVEISISEQTGYKQRFQSTTLT